MKKLILYGLLLSTVIAFFISPFASSSPDGLERVAQDKSFIHTSEGKEILSSPIPDYTVPGIKNEAMAVGLSGIIGTLITFLFAFGFGYIIKNKENRI